VELLLKFLVFKLKIKSFMNEELLPFTNLKIKKFQSSMFHSKMGEIDRNEIVKLISLFLMASENFK